MQKLHFQFKGAIGAIFTVPSHKTEANVEGGRLIELLFRNHDSEIISISRAENFKAFKTQFLAPK